MAFWEQTKRWRTASMQKLASLMFVLAASTAVACGGDTPTENPPQEDTGTGDATSDTINVNPDASKDSSDANMKPDAANDSTPVGDDAADSGTPVDDASDSGTPVDDASDSGTPVDDASDSGTPVDDASDSGTVADAGDDSSTTTDSGTGDGGTALPTISISSAKVDEGSTGTTTMTFTVTLSAPSASDVSVAYSTADGTAVTSNTAVGGSDYSAASGTITFAPGETTKSISVTVNGDGTYEPDETFTVNLASPSGATLATASATGTITNDDAQPALSVNDVTVTEGNSGSALATFTITLSAPSGEQVKVDYKTTDGTGVAGTDYTSTTGSLTFAPGETSKTVTVSVTGDTTAEPNETFTLDLSNSTGASVTKASGTATIQNDDGTPVPTLSIANASTSEGNSGTKTMTFTVNLSFASTQTVTVNYATADGTGASGAVSTGATSNGGADFVAANGTLTFAPGETSKTVTVTVNGDALDENDETFSVVLSGAANANISQATATGTITNDDTAPTVTITNAAPVAEGQGGVRPSTFTISLSAPSGKTVSVNYATADGTGATGAVSGGSTPGTNDYVGSSGTINFSPGTTSQTVSVVVNGDTLNEADETFDVNLASPVNATLGATTKGTGTITNDDPLPIIWIASNGANEGNSGTTPVSFQVNLRDQFGNTVTSGRPVTVNYATADGVSLNPATLADNDYVQTSGTLTFSPGQSSQFVTVQVNGDTKAEVNETFRVLLSSPTNATITTTGNQGTATGTIQNDDGSLILIRAGVAPNVTEGNTGTSAKMTIPVTLSTPVPTGQTVTVQYSTADGTATAPADYTATTGTLTFVAGESSKSVSVNVVGDNLDEANETVLLNLSNPSANAAIQIQQGGGVITDDDPLPIVSIQNAKTVTEGALGTSQTAGFSVNLNAPSGRTVTVSYSTANGTAQSGGTSAAGTNDFTAATGTVTFAPGETAKTVNVTVNGDNTYEGAPNNTSEAFSVGLSNPVNATVSATQGSGQCIITNDDNLPSISINDVKLSEGSTINTITPFVFTITLSNPSQQTVTVNYFTPTGGSGVTASFFGPNPDLAFAFGQLTFAPGETTKTVTLNVNHDTVKEADEIFFLNLNTANGASIADASGTGTILNDD